MQSFSSRIWTRVAVSISYDDNHYTTDTVLLYNVTLKYSEFSLSDGQELCWTMKKDDVDSFASQFVWGYFISRD